MPSVLSPEAFNHPQFEGSIQTGMKIIGNVVELKDENKIVDWFLEKKKEEDVENWGHLTSNMFHCSSYKEEQEYVKQITDINDKVWKYFDFNQLILDDWKFGSNRDCIDDTFIVIKKEDGYFLLEDLADELPIWKDRIEEFFKGMPCKDNIYIIHQT
jgi:hypothetical protein